MNYIEGSKEPYLKAILHVPSLLTIQAPTGFIGLHSVLKSLHSSGLATPRSIGPQIHPVTTG